MYPSNPPDVSFLLDNVKQSVWTRLDSLIKYCNVDFETSSNSLKNSISYFFWGGMVLIIVFLLFTLVVGVWLNKDVNLFINAFSKINEDDLIAIKNSLADYLDSFNSEKELVEKKRKAIKFLKEKKSKDEVKRKSFSLSEVFIRNYLLIIKLWPFFIILGVTILVNFLLTSSSTEQVLISYQGVHTARLVDYLSNLGQDTTISSIATNLTGTEAYGLITAKSAEILSSLGQTSVISNPFKDYSGQIDPVVYPYLYNVPCSSDIINIDPKYYKLCMELTAGSGNAGLVMATVAISQQMRVFLETFRSTTRDDAAIADYLKRSFTQILPLTDFQYLIIEKVIEVLDQASADNIAKEFLLIDNLTIIICVSMSILTLIVVPIVVHKIAWRTDELKRILSILPVHILYRNRYLRNYLVKTSGKDGSYLNKLA